MKNACEREVRELHRAFEAWFRGEGPGGAPFRLAEALAPEFHRVGPGGRRGTRATTVDLVARAYASRGPEFSISIHAFEVHHESPGLCVVSYEEWQRDGSSTSARISTAVFRKEPSAPEGIVWVLLHETWRPPPPDPDPLFADPRLAVLYDALDGERDDLDAYEALIQEFGAKSVLDVGCGTGTFACRLALRGLKVFGVDPAAASIDLAREKPGGNLVDWSVGDVATLSPLTVDLVTMTGNVAQVFVEDEDWHQILLSIHRQLRPGGQLVFETRDPNNRSWESWSPETLGKTLQLPDGPVDVTFEMRSVELPLVRFRYTFHFPDGSTVTSDSTLRFRDEDEVRSTLDRAGFIVRQVRDAPDRPGRELVFVATRP